MQIIVDTREQRAWSFPPQVEVEAGTIKSGDYAIKGDEEKFAIERKSAADFVGTLATGWPRFVREINRMEKAGFPAKIIIIEANFEEFCFNYHQGRIIAPDHEHVRCSPAFIMKRIAQLSMRNVSVLFAGNPELASALALRIFFERQEFLEQELQSENANNCNS